MTGLYDLHKRVLQEAAKNNLVISLFLRRFHYRAYYGLMQSGKLYFGEFTFVELSNPLNPYVGRG